MTNPLHAHSSLPQVIELFQPKQVLILTARGSYEYLTPDPPGPANGSTHGILRSLQTSGWSQDPLAPSLEAPNTIIGEAAAGA